MRQALLKPALILLAALPLQAGLAEEVPPSAAQKSLQSFLGKYCLECHDADVQKGDRAFDQFRLPLKSPAHLTEARDIIDQLTLGEMPPRKATQPKAEERLQIIRSLRDEVAATSAKLQGNGSRTALRRLSSREYENTLAVLFGRRVDTLGLTADFPKEKTAQHLDNIGKSLVTSGFLVDQYFQAASRLVETRLAKPITAARNWHFNGHFVQYEELQGSHKSAFNYRYLNLYEQPNSDTRQGGYGHIEDFKAGVPVSGLYDLTVEACALHRDTHYDPAIFGIDLSEPFQLGVVPGDVTKGHIHYPQAIEPLLASAVVPDNKPTALRFRVWLEAGQTPRFIFPNGPQESRAAVITINRRYKDEFKAQIGTSGVGRAHILLEGKLPHIRISDIRIHGPIAEQAGSLEEATVFGPGGFEASRAIAQLCDFARRAYRRNLNAADRAPIEALYHQRIAQSRSPRQAALDCLKLILCSPHFLYLSEITDESQRRLRPEDLACRISYALWAQPPDKPLRQAAESGRLNDESGLRSEILRLINDPRLLGFLQGFTDSWLNLRDLGSQPPPRDSARLYYAQDLPNSMRTEVRLFVHDLIARDGPLDEFMDCRHAFVDKKLAALYDLPESRSLRLADGFTKVTLGNNHRRGGLLGMAAVLTVSANGVETSPVTRGVWINEFFLGTPPPPPPDVVPAIDPDVTGATSIRDRLARHRADSACAECHRKIDPFGFAMENFDPIGRWRQNYPKIPNSKKPSLRIDPSGELPSGETYADAAQFKALLAKGRRDFFVRHLIRQLLSYSSGRLMEQADEAVIDRLLEKWRQDNTGLRSLIVQCLMSEVVTSR